MISSQDNIYNKNIFKDSSNFFSLKNVTFISIYYEAFKATYY